MQRANSARLGRWQMGHRVSTRPWATPKNAMNSANSATKWRVYAKSSVSNVAGRWQRPSLTVPSLGASMHCFPSNAPAACRSARFVSCMGLWTYCSCLFLGAPGVAFGLALDDDTSGVSCRVRVLIAMESVVVATVSAFGDGFLIQRILWWDHRITAPAHGVIWIVLFAALTVNGRISTETMLGLLVLGIATLLVFLTRAYYITVRQDPVISRRLGRAFTWPRRF